MRQLGRVRPARKRRELLVILCVFAGNVYPRINWFRKIPREVRMRSTTYDKIIEEGERKGREEGLAQGKLEVLSEQLRERLGDDADDLIRRLTQGLDEDRLREVGRLLVSKRTKRQLREALDAILPAR